MVNNFILICLLLILGLLFPYAKHLDKVKSYEIQDYIATRQVKNATWDAGYVSLLQADLSSLSPEEFKKITINPTIAANTFLSSLLVTSNEPDSILARKRFMSNHVPIIAIMNYAGFHIIKPSANPQSSFDVSPLYPYLYTSNNGQKAYLTLDMDDVRMTETYNNNYTYKKVKFETPIKEDVFYNEIITRVIERIDFELGLSDVTNVDMASLYGKLRNVKNPTIIAIVRDIGYPNKVITDFSTSEIVAKRKLIGWEGAENLEQPTGVVGKWYCYKDIFTDEDITNFIDAGLMNNLREEYDMNVLAEDGFLPNKIYLVKERKSD